MAALGSSTGGGYQLTHLDLRAGAEARGGSYQLTALSAPVSSENGCCCAYLPCIRR